MIITLAARDLLPGLSVLVEGRWLPVVSFEGPDAVFGWVSVGFSGSRFGGWPADERVRVWSPRSS